MKRRYRLMVMTIFVAVAAWVPARIALAQTNAPAPVSENPFDPAVIGATLFYGALGIALFILSFFLFDKLLKLDLQRELVEDQNESIGIMLAGMFIGIAIIIASAIVS